MYRAIILKDYIEKEISLKGWWSLMVRALPMLISENPDFPILGIEKKTLWNSKEVEIVQFHFQKAFNKEIPTEVIFDSFYQPERFSERVKDAFSQVGAMTVKLVRQINL